MKTSTTIISFITCSLALVLQPSLKGDVYLLGRGPAANALGGATAGVEPVTVNGLDTTMTVKLVSKAFSDCVSTLVKAYPNARFAANKTSLLVDIEHPNGSIERLYLVRLDGKGRKYPVIQFSMEFPNGLPAHLEWPDSLPRPPGAIPTTTMIFQKRHMTYASFSSPVPPDRVVASMMSDLLSNGWRELGKGVFLRDNPMEIVMVSTRLSDKGTTLGVVIKHPLGKNP